MPGKLCTTEPHPPSPMAFYFTFRITNILIAYILFHCNILYMYVMYLMVSISHFPFLSPSQLLLIPSSSKSFHQLLAHMHIHVCVPEVVRVLFEFPEAWSLSSGYITEENLPFPPATISAYTSLERIGCRECPPLCDSMLAGPGNHSCCNFQTVLFVLYPETVFHSTLPILSSLHLPVPSSVLVLEPGKGGTYIILYGN